jgi:hypothetical protein
VRLGDHNGALGLSGWRGELSSPPLARQRSDPRVRQAHWKGPAHGALIAVTSTLMVRAKSPLIGCHYSLLPASASGGWEPPVIVSSIWVREEDGRHLAALPRPCYMASVLLCVRAHTMDCAHVR